MPEREGVARMARWKPWLALVVFAAAAVVATYPVAWHLDEKLAGDGADANLFVWNHWWLAKALSEGENPYHTTEIFWPTGTSLVLHTFSPYHGVLSLFLAPWMGHVAAYNLLVLLSFALAAWSGYLLTREITGSEPAGYVAGFAFGFTGYHFAHALGHLNLIAYHWIALFLLFFIRYLRSGQRRQAVFAALMVLGAGLTDYGMLFTIALLAVVFVLAWHGWRKAAAWRALLVTGGVSALLFSPWIVLILREIMGSPELSTFSSEAERYSVDVFSYVVPTGLATLYGDFGRVLPPNGTATESTVFLGYALLALAAYGLWRVPWARTRPYVVVAAVFYVLSLGPTLIVAGVRTGVPMPYTLFTWTPILNTLRTPARFGLVVALCVAVLAAMGVAHLLTRLPRALPRLRVAAPALAALFCVLVVAESAFVPFPMTPLRASPLYEDAKALGSEAIVDLPLHQPGYAGQLGRVNYLAAQTQHGEPIVNGYNARQTARDTQTIVAQQVLSMLTRMELHLAPLEKGDVFPQQDARAVAGDLLARRGMTALLLHRSQPPTPTEAEEIAFLETLRGVRLVKEGPDGALYQAVPNATPPALMFDLVDGWHGVEIFDDVATRWTMGDARLLVYAAEPTRGNLSFNATPFLGGLDWGHRLLGYGFDARTIQVIVEGEVVLERALTGGWESIEVPVALGEGQNHVTIRSVEPAFTPRQAGINWDSRHLAFGVQSIRITPETPVPSA